MRTTLELYILQLPSPQMTVENGLFISGTMNVVKYINFWLGLKGVESKIVQLPTVAETQHFAHNLCYLGTNSFVTDVADGSSSIHHRVSKIRHGS